MSTAPAAADPVAVLREWENLTRREVDFADAPTSETTMGTDPYVLRALPSAAAAPARYVGVLRGRSALVLLDGDLAELDRVPAPRSPTGLAVAKDGTIAVVGELSSDVAFFRSSGGRLRAAGSITLTGVEAMRDVAFGPENVLYVVEEHGGRLVTVALGGSADAPTITRRQDAPLCRGPFRVQRTAHQVVADCLLDHAVIARTVDADGMPSAADGMRIVRDGPIWGMDALDDGPGGLLVAVGAVEDHPLDRTQGSFAFIDSFVTLYEFIPVPLAGPLGWGTSPGVQKLAEVNASEMHLVTPKVIRLSRDAGGATSITAAGYATEGALNFSWKAAPPGAPLGEPTITRRAVPPGSASAVATGDDFAIANPLLDAWVLSTPTGVRVQHVDDGTSKERSEDSRVGEALFFTTLMAPWNKSDGRLSRFTCETCHWEGYVDGRNHHTGRQNIHATTKPLLGLMSNRPHFSRALDPDMATMVNAEFGVAGAKSDHPPWFAVEPREFDWLGELGVDERLVPPEVLRRSLMTFLMEFTHRPNPSTVGRTRFSPLERRGAAVFRDRCEGCHQARLVADTPSTRVPFDAWEEEIFSPADALVWATSDYAMTGVEPYVNERGARIVSLRRLYKKHPYFTNATAHELADVLDRARFRGEAFFHENAPADATALGSDEKAGLAAFLDLL